MYMVLSLFRDFSPMVRVTENFPVTLKQSLVGKKVLIVGHGSFGTQI
jgi:lactate dehydrogenase-like 2-hydroxyacid dehydrogenase